MRATGLALATALLAASGWPAAPEPAGPQDQEAEKTRDKTLVAHPSESWLKVYPLPIYKESWRLEMAVKDLARALPLVRQAFAKVGASLAEPAEAAAPGKVRRMTYHCSRKSARLALQELKQIGAFVEPSVRPILEPVSLSEVQGKIAALEADKAGHAGELSRMPAVSALVEELLGHLRGLETALRDSEVEVLLHLTVREKG